ncbi:glucosamine-6-phosphate deaminase [Clostridia bacterium]|nr:glucosamine-6-phosphate deaminase [Clostridia bacterium]
MKIEHFGNYDEMSVRAAEIVAREISAKSGKYVLGLPTGSTPLGMYAELARLAGANKLSFDSVTTFNLDEYYPITRDNPQSYYRFMHDNFFDKIKIDKKRINILNGEASDPQFECESYEQKINSVGGIDLMVLGLGANGHIGFNEPGEFLYPFTHVETLTANTREMNQRFFSSLFEVPTKAMTMGMASVLRAKKILLLVSGETKREAFRILTDRKITTASPASFLYTHTNVTILSDLD